MYFFPLQDIACLTYTDLQNKAYAFCPHGPFIERLLGCRRP